MTATPTTITNETATLTKYRMYIGGQWVDASDGECFESDNPYTARPWALDHPELGVHLRRLGTELAELLVGPCGVRPAALR